MGRTKARLNPKASERIKLLLRERKMTQRELANQAGLSEQLVSGILGNNRGLTEEVAKMIADVFKPVSYEWIMGDSDNRTNAERILRGMNLRAERSNKIVELIDLHGYSVSENLEDAIKFYVGFHHAPDMEIILTAPDGEKRRIKFSSLIPVIKEIDDYIAFKISGIFKE